MHTLDGHGNGDRLDRRRDRVIAGAATALLYLPLPFVLLRPSIFLNPIAVTPHPAETLLELLPQPRPQAPPKLDFITHLIRPKAVNAPMPQIVLAPQPIPAPRAALPVTAAETSVMAGGAVQGVGAVSGTGTGGNGTGQSACVDPAYLAEIVRHVARHFHYPPDAAQLGLTGITYVRFQIDRNGRLRSQSVAISSGHRKLDDYALVLMREAAPLPPIPERMHTDQLSGLLPIRFAIEGRLVPREMMAGQSANGCN